MGTGAVVSLLVQPFDVLRTHMQAEAASPNAAMQGTLASARSISRAAGSR